MTPTDPQWERRLGESTARLQTLGLPQATEVYRRPTGDGHLWALLQQDDRGWTLVLTHTALDPIPSFLVPGRLPTLAEIIAARRQLLPERALMVVLLSRATQVLQTRLHASRPDVFPYHSGLPTTVRCVEAHIEELTDDVVLGAP
jgi:hypothetical protein